RWSRRRYRRRSGEALLYHRPLRGVSCPYGVIRGGRAEPHLPHNKHLLDSGLVFGAKVFVSVVPRYGLDLEYITPYSPEQNGMIERFFRTLKEECLWHHRFASRNEVFLVIAAWLEKYHTERPHSPLGFLTPREFAEQLAVSSTETKGTLHPTRRTT